MTIIRTRVSFRSADRLNRQPVRLQFCYGLGNIRGVITETPALHQDPETESAKVLGRAGKWFVTGMAFTDRLPETGAIVMVAPVRATEPTGPARVLGLVPR